MFVVYSIDRFQEAEMILTLQTFHVLREVLEGKQEYEKNTLDIATI